MNKAIIMKSRSAGASTMDCKSYANSVKYDHLAVIGADNHAMRRLNPASLCVGARMRDILEALLKKQKIRGCINER